MYVSYGLSKFYVCHYGLNKYMGGATLNLTPGSVLTRNLVVIGLNTCHSHAFNCVYREKQHDIGRRSIYYSNVKLVSKLTPS